MTYQQIMNDFADLLEENSRLKIEIYDLKVTNKELSLNYITLTGELQTHLESLPKVKAAAIREAADRCQIDNGCCPQDICSDSLYEHADKVERGEA